MSTPAVDTRFEKTNPFGFAGVSAKRGQFDSCATVLANKTKPMLAPGRQDAKTSRKSEPILRGRPADKTKPNRPDDGKHRFNQPGVGLLCQSEANSIPAPRIRKQNEPNARARTQRPVEKANPFCEDVPLRKRSQIDPTMENTVQSAGEWPSLSKRSQIRFLRHCIGKQNEANARARTQDAKTSRKSEPILRGRPLTKRSQIVLLCQRTHSPSHSFIP